VIGVTNPRQVSASLLPAHFPGKDGAAQSFVLSITAIQDFCLTGKPNCRNFSRTFP
jgi:hypothetical protein